MCFPYVFLQLLNLTTSSLLYNFGVAKIRDITSAAIEANKSKFGTQLWFGKKSVKATSKTQIAGVLRRTPQISVPL